MLKRLFQLSRDYRHAKEETVEHTVNVLESKTTAWYVILFSSATAFQWLYAVFRLSGFEILYYMWGFYPIVAFFITSYFSIFTASKLLFKLSNEELLDDTSKFAIFSACGRKEMRSLISIGLSVVHTLIFTLYLINKDLAFL